MSLVSVAKDLTSSSESSQLFGGTAREYVTFMAAKIHGIRSFDHIESANEADD